MNKSLSQYKKAVLLYNPSSGGGEGAKFAEDFLARWREKYDLELEVKGSESGEDLRKKAVESYTPKSLLIVMGGDGSFSHAIQAISLENGFSGLKNPIGLLPAGTGNSYIREFGVSRYREAVERFFQALDEGRVCRSDAAILSSSEPITGIGPDISGFKADEKRHIFINAVGFGMVSSVSLLARRLPLNSAAAYTFAALYKEAVHPLTSYEVSIDGKKRKTRSYFITIHNTRYIGGNMKFAPGLEMADGKLFYVNGAFSSRFKLFWLFPRVFSGTHLNDPELESGFIGSFSIHSPERISANIDGEDVMVCRPEIKILPEYFSVYF